MQECLWLIAAYCAGCINSGYYWVKLRYGHDIRQSGSGNAGARNAGRMYGTTSFLVSLIGDASKAAIMIGIARWIGMDHLWQLTTLLMVLLGHIYPLQLRGQGGKGMASFIGGCLAIGGWAVVGMLSVGVVAAVLIRKPSLAGLISVVSYPIWRMIWHDHWAEVLISALITVLIMYTHRSNLLDYIRR